MILYDGNFSEETKNFTQMLWQDSFYVGIASGYSEETKEFITVALYYPPGNVFDEERGLRDES